MRLTLEALQIIDSIARRGSFAAAATELHRTPSALTYQVQKLEEDLDVLVFDRRGHRAVLTVAGRELLAEGRNLLRAADALEQRVKRLASGWEPDLRIALEILIPADRLFPLLADFQRERTGTRLRIGYEVLSGGWDALAHDRADLAIGVSGDAPAGGGYSARTLGPIDFLFAVAPSHPLAAVPDPIPRDAILQFCAIAIADTSRNLPPRSSGLLTGQEVVTVPDLSSKRAAQVAGIGVGYLPRSVALADVATGRLVVKEVEEEKPGGELMYAWRTTDKGKALRWFLKRLEDPQLRQWLASG